MTRQEKDMSTETPKAKPKEPKPRPKREDEPPWRRELKDLTVRKG